MSTLYHSVLTGCLYLLHLGDAAALAVVARRHGLPLLGERHHGSRVQHAEAEQVVELETHAVHGPVEAVLGVEQGVALGREYGQVLDVSPGQLRTATIQTTQSAVLKKLVFEVRCLI